MTESVKSIPFATMVNLSNDNLNLSRSKVLGRLKVTIGNGDDSKTVYGSDLIKNTLRRLSSEREKTNAFDMLSRLKEMADPKPMTLIARICLKIARIFSSGSLAKLRHISLVRSIETDHISNRMYSEIRNNPEALIEWLRPNGRALQYPDEETIRNRSDSAWVQVKQESQHEVNEERRDDRQEVLANMEQNGQALEPAIEVLPHLEVDRAAILQNSISSDEARVAVSQNGLELQNMSEAHRSDSGVVMLAVQQNGLALQYAFPEALRFHYSLVLDAVKQNGLALQYAHQSLRGHRNIVMAAIRQNGLALEYASVELRNDSNMVLPAVEQNGLALQFTNPLNRDSFLIARAAVVQNGLALQYASERLQDDLQLVLQAVRENPAALQYASVNLQNDPDIISAASV